MNPVHIELSVTFNKSLANMKDLPSQFLEQRLLYLHGNEYSNSGFEEDYIVYRR